MLKWPDLRLVKKKPGDKNSREKKQDTMRLWEREFDVVKHGLDEGQVTSFVNNLIETHNTAKAASSASIRSLLKKAVTDAEELATNIRIKAQAEAESESAATINRARQEVQDIIRKAELAAQKDAQDTIAVANRKAQIIEVESRQKALIFLLKAREDIEKEVLQEYKNIYSGLSASLQNLASEGQNIEVELKGKRAKLWDSKNIALNEYETALLGTADVATLHTDTITATEIEIEPDIADKDKSARLLEEKMMENTTPPAKLPGKHRKKRIEETAQLKEEPIAKVLEQPVKLQEVYIEEKVEEIQLQEEPGKEVPAQPAELPETHVEEKIEEIVQLQEEPIKGVPAQPAGAVADIKQARYVAPDMDIERPFSGELELDIAVPVDLNVLSKLYDYLQSVRELRVVHTRGSWDRGTTITVVIEKPIPLISMILKIPDVTITPELLTLVSPADDTSGTPVKGKKKGINRIRLYMQAA